VKSNGVCPWCLAMQVHCRCSIWGHRPNSFCVVRHEVRTNHLCDRKLHCVVLHSNPWVVTSQGNSREFVAWSVCNRVQGGQTDTYGCFVGVPFFLGYTPFTLIYTKSSYSISFHILQFNHSSSCGRKIPFNIIHFNMNTP